MSALPDHFDLGVRRAREARPDRQVDCLLGLLYAQEEWWFYNQGTAEKPVPALAEAGGAKCVVVFSSIEKLSDMVAEGADGNSVPLPSIEIAVPDAAAFCLLFRAAGCTAILVNPGEYAFTVELDALEKFDAERRANGPKFTSGFWIPNMTTEEEDFWQQYGV